MSRALTPAEAQAAIAGGAVPLDLRDPATFGEGHVPGAVNVVYSRRHLGERIATVLPPEADGPRLVLIGPDGDVPEEAWAAVAEELEGVGFPAPAGYLAGGTAAWAAAGRPLAMLPALGNAELAAAGPAPVVLDVREPFEWEDGVIAGAVRLSLGSLPAALAAGAVPGLDPARPVAVICGAGVRSSSAASLLRRHGYAQVANLIEGMQGWYRQGRPVA